MKETRFKQTEIGLIPEDWEILSVGKDCTVKARIGWQGLTTSEYMLHGKYGLITSTDIVNGKINWSSCFFVSKFRYEQDKNIIIKAGDILISKDGTIGKVGIVSEIPFPATLNSGVFVVRSKNQQLQYATALAFISPYFKDFIKRLTAGSTIIHLYQKDIVKFTYPVPKCIEEQNKIASALTTIDNLLLSLDKLIEKKRLIKQGAMQELLTGKKRLPGFAGEWVERRLGEISEMNSGGTPSVNVKEYYGYGIPFLSISDMSWQGKYLKQTEKSITYLGLKNSSARIVPSGTILYAMYASIGKCSIANIELAISQAILGIKVNKEVLNNLYLYYYLSFIENKAKEIGQQGTQSNLSKQIVEKFKIQLPTIKEQQTIATVLSSIDKEIESLEGKKAKYEQIKQGMMQQLLTGKIRLIS